MSTAEKQVHYQTTNTYSTLNKFTSKTQNVWLACHGMGYLSRYFIAHFKGLNPKENFVVAPQAPAKYYQDKKFKYVGASWLTKEKTQLEMQNVLKYLDDVYEAEKIEKAVNLMVFGFSQGVSVSLRWLKHRKITPKMIVIYAGRIPEELIAEDFEYLKTVKVKLIYGKEDEFITEERLKEQYDFAQSLFGKNNEIEVIQFNGKHEMNPQVIKNLVE